LLNVKLVVHHVTGRLQKVCALHVTGFKCYVKTV
jgi:hypothetical protein